MYKTYFKKTNIDYLKPVIKTRDWKYYEDELRTLFSIYLPQYVRLAVQSIVWLSIEDAHYRSKTIEKQSINVSENLKKRNIYVQGNLYENML